MTAKARPSRQNPQATRLRILEAGRSLLLAQRSREYVDVRLADACIEAGYTTGAAYPIWTSQREYQEDLARFVVSSFDWAGPESIADELLEIVAATDDYTEAVRQSTALYLQRFVAKEDFYLALRFWSVRQPTSELAAALVDGYRVVHDGFAELFDGLLAVYGRRLRPPATIAEVTILVTAMVEGLALRHRVEPTMVEQGFIAPDAELTTVLAEGMIAVIDHFSEPIPDSNE